MSIVVDTPGVDLRLCVLDCDVQGLVAQPVIERLYVPVFGRSPDG
jgi:hypothetical protein